MNGLREHLGWDLKTLAKLPFMVWVRRMEVDFLRPAVGDQEITIMSFVREFRGPDEGVGPGLRGLDGKTVFGQLEQHYGDLLSAMQWFTELGHTDEGLRLAISLTPFWMATKRLDEGSAWFDRALAMTGGLDSHRGRALFDAGYLAFWKGDNERRVYSEDPMHVIVEVYGVLGEELHNDVFWGNASFDDISVQGKIGSDRLMIFPMDRFQRSAKQFPLTYIHSLGERR